MAKPATNKITCVMDASVLLAVFFNEPYNDDVPALFDNAVISTFNLAEAVNSILIKKGGNEDLLWNYLGNFVQNHYPIDDTLSYEAIKLTKLTKASGLSLGDKYCLALGKILQVPVYTADRVWQTYAEELGIKITLIR